MLIIFLIVIVAWCVKSWKTVRNTAIILPIIFTVLVSFSSRGSGEPMATLINLPICLVVGWLIFRRQNHKRMLKAVSDDVAEEESSAPN